MASQGGRAPSRHGRVTVAGILVWALLTANGIVASGSEGPFGFDRLRQEAQRLAAQPYRPAGTDLPQMWRDLDYDGHRAITFRPDKALWREENLPFRVEFHHRGYLFRERIRISIVEGGTETPVPFSPDLFDYSAGEADGQGLPDDFGFAGFRLTHPINGPVDHEEFITFLGASYFRAVGRHQVYGASARGLAIGMGSRDEEFPLFTEFWIEKPAPEATAIVVYAMLDSPSVTGAYRFEIRPGRDTVVAVRAELFARKALGTVGLAPLTSMYLYGPSGPDRLRDARPQVHDSDGLLIAEASDKWTWRPLSNPRAVSLDDAPVKSLHGFGLMQRDRDPDHYRDPRTTYEKRPSIWVEVPDSGSVDSAAPWRQGTVRLLELPSDGEGQDNIGACWLPAGTIRPGQRLPVSYQLRFGPGAPQDPDLGKVAATRWSGSANGATRFEVDFDLPGSAATSPEAVVTATRGRVGPAQVHRDPSGRYWRAVFDVPSGSGQATALRVLLRIDGRPATETWSFAWPR